MPVSSDYIRMSLEELTTPKAGRLVVKDHWWALTENGEALFYKTYTSPQCNTSRQIAAKLGPGGTVATFVPLAFVPHNCGDYR